MTKGRGDTRTQYYCTCLSFLAIFGEFRLAKLKIKFAKQEIKFADIVVTHLFDFISNILKDDRGFRNIQICGSVNWRTDLKSASINVNLILWEVMSFLIIWVGNFHFLYVNIRGGLVKLFNWKTTFIWCVFDVGVIKQIVLPVGRKSTY